MNILIIGIHGFVGSNLVKYLSKENTIYGLDIVQPEKEGVKCTFSWEALDQPNVLPEIDAIIHLAGKAHDTRDKSAADVYFKVNTELTKKIFDWYMASPSARKFVFFSTAKAAAERVPEILLENVTPTPKGPYGESKIQAEEYILRALELQGVSKKSMVSIVPGTDRPKNGKEVYIFRPCMIHGPGNKGNLNLLYNVVSKGIPWPLGAFENRRSFTSVQNLCTVIEGFLTQKVESGIYHMADDDPLSTNELIEVICEALGKKTRILYIPKGVMNVMAEMGGWLHLPLNPFRMQKLTENYVVSNAKIKKALGLQKMPVSAKEGLACTILSFKK